METRSLGNSGMKVSQIGLGCGGNSRLGLSTGGSEEQAAEVVRSALIMGVTLIDTARGYGTERAVGVGMKDWPREQVVLSSKSPYLDADGALLSAQKFQQNLDASLSELGMERIEVYFIHGLAGSDYAKARDRFRPGLERAKQEGKIRLFGLTEVFERDTRHEMLQLAVADGGWDIFMVGYNLLNQSARARVLTPAHQKGIATLGMFAVRRGLIGVDLLRVVLQRLAEMGEIDPGLAQEPDLMAALGLEGVCSSLVEAAYRFCAFEPTLDAVLSGTGSSAHLRMNLDAVAQGPLPVAAIMRLRDIFGRVEGVSGQVR